MNYTPEMWKIVEVRENGTNNVHHRVLGCWTGGYLHGNSWKLSSGIEAIFDEEDEWRSPQTSGSTYFLSKTGERMSGFMAGIFKNLAESEKDTVTISVKDFDSVKELYLTKP